MPKSRRFKQLQKALKTRWTKQTAEENRIQKMSRIVQRARKPNYTREETETLLDQLILYGQFLFNKGQPINNQVKADVWANIATQVNAVPNSAGRTVDELKHRWQDMAQRARHAMRKTPSEPPSNGSKAPPKPVPFLHKILQILGETQNRDVKGHFSDEAGMLLASVDSTPYSSDSSCANIKEEMDNDNNQNIVSDPGQARSNGLSMSNSIKRSLSETTDFIKFTNENEKTSSDSPSSLSTLLSKNLNHSSSTPCDKNGNSNSANNDDYEVRFESKRRRMKKSSSPRKSISTLTYNSHNFDANYDEENDNYESVRIQHKDIETFRSMVLDPDSEIVMEMEGGMTGVEGDGASQSSPNSVVNMPPAVYKNSQIDFSNDAEDKGENEYLETHQDDDDHQRQQWKTGEEGVPSNLLPVTVTSIANNGHQAICRNNKQPSSLPQFLVNSNKSKINLSTHTRSHNVYHGSQQISSGHDRGAHPLDQQLDLETLSKSDLDRRSVISQIQMQDQRTRYLLLKEQKVKLEIELLKGKCVCQDLNSTNMDSTTFTKKSNSSQKSMSSSSAMTGSRNRRNNAFPTLLNYLSTQHETGKPVIPSSQLLKKGDEGTDFAKEKESLSDQMNVSKISEFSDKTDGDLRAMTLDRVKIEVNHSVEDTGDDKSDNENEDNDDEENEEDVSLMVSFGDENDSSKGGDDSLNLNNGVDGNLFGSEPKTGEDWEKNLQENIGL